MKELTKDNWLRDEKARESRISIWEMYDNRKAVYNDHQENCEREQVASFHTRKHNAAIASNRATENKSLEALITSVATVIVIILMGLIFALV